MPVDSAGQPTRDATVHIIVIRGPIFRACLSGACDSGISKCVRSGTVVDLRSECRDGRKVLIQDIPPLAAIHQHRDTRGYSAALSIRIFHNARCTVISIVSFALIAGAVCFGLSR
jgi:hypothetical protein